MKQSGGESTPVKILFVCVGNACRSQMAEAFANHLGNGRVKAWSAGSSPLGWIAAGTEEAMAEKGISLAGQWSKGLEDVPVGEMDIVVGMGCEVACPVPAGFKGRVIQWSIPDPYGRGFELFREVRDTIERQVTDLLAEITAGKEIPQDQC
ncbi:MAG TPA: arsenate reductase ArsC [Terriglobia bacterium]|jgi:arsenate reductase|nr:arsenate reductase ArsC [Terriglobia bacterium]